MMEKVMNKNGFLNQLKLKRKTNITCNLSTEIKFPKELFLILDFKLING
jgi:hypothetical protein